MKSKCIAVLCVLCAGGSPIVAQARVANAPAVSASASQAALPRKADDVPVKEQGHPPVDAASDRGMMSGGSTSGSSGAGVSTPMQALPPTDNKPLPKPY